MPKRGAHLEGHAREAALPEEAAYSQVELLPAFTRPRWVGVQRL